MPQGFLIISACVLASLALLSACWAAVVATRARKLMDERLRKCEQELAAAMSGAIGMGSRIVHLERKLQQLCVAQATTAGAEGALYTQAMQLFDSGADVSSVVASCGISSSEANLMALVRRKTQRAAVAEER